MIHLPVQVLLKGYYRLRFLFSDPCDDFRCKRGKTCKLDADNKPGCVCQEPSQCPPSVTEFDHVSTRELLRDDLEGFATVLHLIVKITSKSGVWDRQQNIRHILRALCYQMQPGGHKERPQTSSGLHRPMQM